MATKKKKSSKPKGPPRHSPGRFNEGFHEGVRDVQHHKPLRRAKGKDSYSNGYRAGCREARKAKLHKR